jgi:hypothetical protein
MPKIELTIEADQAAEKEEGQTEGIRVNRATIYS